jgi:hypothetical protein
MLEASLQTIKKCGFDPKRILDIGANAGGWTSICERIFPEATYVLIDGNKHGQWHGNKTYIVEILADQEKEIDWYCVNGCGDSVFKEVTPHWADVKPERRRATTLDRLFFDPTSPLPEQFDLIKIDAQGSEIPILRGGENLIKNTSFILLEMPFFAEFNKGIPSFLEHVSFMDGIGFIPYSVTELHTGCWQMKEATIQIDIMFINKTHEINDLVQHTLNNLGKS